MNVRVSAVDSVGPTCRVRVPEAPHEILLRNVLVPPAVARGRVHDAREIAGCLVGAKFTLHVLYKFCPGAKSTRVSKALIVCVGESGHVQASPLP